MADPNDTRGEPPREIHIEKKSGTNWLAWLALLAGILALLFALSRCNRREAVVTNTTDVATTTATTVTPPVPVERVTLPGGKMVELQPATLNYELQRYLASSVPAPRTFTFDKLNFDTSSAALRADDKPTLNALGQILTAYPKSVVKLVGYADARGKEPANEKLGEQRAQAVAAALTAEGIAAHRVTTATGGESKPVDTNATSQGRFENRRTELVVTAK